MSPTRARPLLSVSLLALALGACSPDRPAEGSRANGQAAPAQAKVPGPTDNPTPVDHPKITVTLHPSFTDEALPVFDSMDQGWVAIKEGEDLVACVRNSDEEKPALVSVSLQGRDINLNPAHPRGPLWRLEPRSMRCFPQIQAKMDLPTIVAWHGYFADGKDGAQMENANTKPSFSGFLRIGTPHEGDTPKAWPGLNPKPPVSPVPALSPGDAGPSPGTPAAAGFPVQGSEPGQEREASQDEGAPKTQ